MNSEDELELQRLKRDASTLRLSLEALDRRIAALGDRVAVAPEPLAAPEPPRLPAKPPEPVVKKAPLPEPAPVAPRPEPPPTPEPPRDPFELRFGTYWMPRIGIVILLTGLVFLGNYAYHRIVPLLGPWGKLALLALAGAALTSLGAWLEHARETLRNYGRVLLAGGAATLYYTAYAAHFVPMLRVIESPILGGALLLAVAGAIVWCAERRGSEPVALLAVALSYYTSAINPIGGFTLFSNVLLAALGVVFLIRHRWARLAWLTLAGTYASFAFWRYAAPSGLDALAVFAVPAFLASYWLLFTSAVFLAKNNAFRASERVSFLTFNNAAFYGLAAHHLMTRSPDSFWLFSIVLGTALLGLSLLATRRMAENRAVDGAYFAQGLLLVTTGIVAHFTGPSLALLLALESALLLGASRWRHGLICDIAAALAALLALGVTLYENQWATAPPTLLTGAVAAVLLFDAWWSKRLRGLVASLDARGAFYSLLALVAVWAITARLAEPPWQSVIVSALAVAGLALLFVSLPEAALLAQAFLVFGIWEFSAREFDSPTMLWMPALHAGIALGLMHWWQRQRFFDLGKNALALEAGAALGAVLASAVWLQLHCNLNERLLVMSGVALASLLYGAGTRSWPLAVAGQLFTVLSVSAFCQSILGSTAPWWIALAPVMNLAITAAILRRLSNPASELYLAPATIGYRLAASLLLGAWGFYYVESPWRMVFFAAVAAAHFLLGAVRKNHERLLVGAAYAALAYLLFWARLGADPKWAELLAILLIPAALRFARWWRGVGLPGRDALVIAAASLWLWVTTKAMDLGWHDYLTVAWGLLALAIFAAGLGLRERIYRLGGFAILALAVGRLFVIDVWSFDTLYRIVSFLLLGVVLLVLSFVYARYAETMKRWL